MSSALIGHTGFVGMNILAGAKFDALYNSSNIEAIVGREFNCVVCCGVSAAKWTANKYPEQDLAAINRLLACLGRVRAARFVLISTIDVYPNSNGKSERDVPDDHHPEAYGRHRRAVERFVEQNFANHLIVRLPALFGPGLKKNAIYDLLHGNMVERVNPAGQFQWYPVSRLPGDLALIQTAGVRLINVACEPIVMREIFAAFFPKVQMPAEEGPAASYDMHTEIPKLLGGHGDYHFHKPMIMVELRDYISRVRN